MSPNSENPKGTASEQRVSFGALIVIFQAVSISLLGLAMRHVSNLNFMILQEAFQMHETNSILFNVHHQSYNQAQGELPLIHTDLIRLPYILLNMNNLLWEREGLSSTWADARV
jgi:hypothetical protein